MTIRLTNYCEMGCWHCMQDSTPRGEHMSKEMFKKTLAFAKSITSLTTLNVSGGEPTSHPKFWKFLKKTLKEFSNIPVVLLTNGSNFDKKFNKKLQKFLLKYENLLVQVTSVPEIYPDYNKVKSNMDELYKFLEQNLHSRVLFFEELELGIEPVGRALKNMDKAKEYGIIFRQGTSCFNMYSGVQKHQGDLVKGINLVKENSRASFCKPLVMETGRVIFGEFNQCSTILNLNDFTIEEIQKGLKIDLKVTDGPCMECITNQAQFDIVAGYITGWKDPSVIDVDIVVEESTTNQNLLPLVEQAAVVEE